MQYRCNLKPEHVCNVCPFYDEWRRKTQNKIDKQDIKKWLQKENFQTDLMPYSKEKLQEIEKKY